MSRMRVFIASSLDGFIAGPNGEIDWLNGSQGAEDTYTPFIKQIGSMLMGRNTFEIVRGFGGEWPYGDMPVLVATNRPLPDRAPSVHGAQGTIEELVARAKEMAGGKDVYVDGGIMIRSALDAGLIDEMTVTMIPIVLGKGIPLFAGANRRHPLRFLSSRSIGGGLVELNYAPDR